MILDPAWLGVAARAVHLAGSLSLLGGLGFASLGGPTPPWLRRAALAMALTGGAAWLAAQAAAWDVTLAAAAWDTRFGRLLLLRLALLAAAALAARRAPGPALLLAAVAVLLQAGIGHGAAEGDTLLAAALALHLLAAGLWLGGLLPLWLALPAHPDRPSLLRRFSALGLGCVTVLAATAWKLADRLEGGLPGLLGTPHGRLALAKLAVFLLLLACAAANRFRLGPALPASLPRLRANIAVEAALGLAVIALAASLSAYPPGAHEQPDWPFAWRPSLAALAEPELAAEIGQAATLALAGLLLLGVAWRSRLAWLRLALAAAAVAAFAAALPHLDLLLVPAGRTSFYRSPTGFSTAAILRGAALYPPHCAACHGPLGRGDGPGAAAAPVPPADLTADHLWDHADGELFGWLADGIRTLDGRVAMPAAGLDAEASWALIDYLRARNAGLAFAATAAWPRPLGAPDFDAVCDDGVPRRLAELRGRKLLLVATADGIAVQAPIACRGDAGALAAYALLAGRLDPGDWLVIDAEGWLRARGHEADPPSARAAALARAARPLPAAPGRPHIH